MKQLLLPLAALAMIALACQSHQSTDPKVVLDKIIEKATQPEEEESDYEKAHKLENFLSTAEPEQKDVRTISEPCAVFVFPDSVQIAKMKGNSTEQEEDFYIAADDNNYYDYLASEFLDSLQVKTIHLKTRYLKCELENETLLLDSRSEASNGWFVVLFEPTQKPRLIDAIEIRKAYKEYYKR
ncbi:hypothetical protein [Mangrovibacterium diazotrophicum]|uniref:Lipoprotein n=1 Tax=Mangrovibacterium diazotrophicum TaxID=1261403 RepID=A0A419VU68_9BACT|nr:hypothetical protein [Mangrovibacterium diazotrophicum]RKD85070.1 hypothetical protein BC643_4589 [Mangrovibacterium diazotrophicum]